VSVTSQPRLPVCSPLPASGSPSSRHTGSTLSAAAGAPRPDRRVPRPAQSSGTSAHAA
jgi:hypothetical protein